MKEDPLVLELFLKDQQTKTDVFVPDCLDTATQTEAAVAGTGGYHAGYLRGVDVIGETSLPVTNQAQTFSWAGHGMKLHIPPNSLPAKLKQCKLHIKVGLSGQFALPENTSLVSAVYWLDSEPRCKFSKSITACRNTALCKAHTDRRVEFRSSQVLSKGPPIHIQDPGWRSVLSANQLWVHFTQ